MPFSTETLPTIYERVRSRLNAAFPTKYDRIELKVAAKAFSGALYLVRRFLDWVALQTNPMTAEDQYLTAWGQFFGVSREQGRQAVGEISFEVPPSVRVTIESGWPLSVGDKDYETFDTKALSTEDNTIKIRAIEKGPGFSLPTGTEVQLGRSVAGITGKAKVISFTDGALPRKDTELRLAMMDRVQNRVQGGAKGDYLVWLRELTPGTIYDGWINFDRPPHFPVWVVTLSQEGSEFEVVKDSEARNQHVAAKAVTSYLEDGRKSPSSQIHARYADVREILVEIQSDDPPSQAVKKEVERELKLAFLDQDTPGAYKRDRAVTVAKLTRAVRLALGTSAFDLLRPTREELNALEPGQLWKLASVEWAGRGLTDE